MNRTTNPKIMVATTNTTLDRRRRRSCCEPLELRYLLAIPSDDFNATALNPRWTFIDPAGGGSLVVDGTNARLSVPGGVDHDVSATANRSVRLMQSTEDESFEVEVKFESIPRQQYQMEGILVESGTPGYFVRFDYFSDGSSLRVFAASYTAGLTSVRYNTPAAGAWSDAPALYMRVRRAGGDWTQSYSVDGSTWVTAASFFYPLSTSRIGVFAGNAGPAPAFGASVDYFFNTAQPIRPEDANYSFDTTAPIVGHIRHASTANTTRVTWDTNELTSGVVEYGRTGQYELGRIGSESGLATSHAATLQVQPGQTYHLRITATNQKGLATASQDYQFTAAQGPSVTLWYGNRQSFGEIGNPQRWVNILGRVQDADGISSLRYSLNGGPSQALEWGPNSLRLQAPGDFNVEIDRADLINGANYVTLIATDRVGDTTNQTVQVDYTAGRVWPADYTADWASAASIGSVAQVVDGQWALGPTGVRPVQVGYDRLITMGDGTWKDYEVVVPVTIHGMTTDGPPGVGVLMRWAGHYDGWAGQPRPLWFPIGALGWYHGGRLEIIGNDSRVIAQDLTGRSITAGTTYVFKMRVQSSAGGPSTYSLKMWPQGSAEPGAWDLSGRGVDGELATGSLLLVAHHTDATFGQVKVSPIVEGPPQIQNVQSQPTATAAKITWSTSELTTGAVQYGRTPQYELGSVSDPVQGTAHSVTLTGLQPSTTYYYRVVATDVAGNTTTSQGFTVATQADTTPPAISNVVSRPSATQAQISWDTNKLATGTVQYGLTTSFELGSVSQGQPNTRHAVTLSGLRPRTTYFFRITARDASGNTTVTSAYQFTTSAGAFRSDDFSKGIDPSLWSFINPQGDGSVSSNGTNALISVPGGRGHDVWAGGNMAPRLMQAASNEDFELEVKFDSAPSAAYQMQGLIVEASPGNYLRLDFFHDGLTLRVFAASFLGDSPTVRYNQAAAVGWAVASALYMRVRRQGDQWTQTYSYDGANWNSAATFTHALAVTKVGVFAGNAGASPPFTASVDYFFNNAFRIDPEDGLPT
jgi:hypothetical protein